MTMDDLLKLFNASLNGLVNNTVTIQRTTLFGFIVSTVDTPDMGPETAIIDVGGAHPVERYTTHEEALCGHTRWIDFLLKKNRNITELGYGALINDKPITLVADKTIEPETQLAQQ